MPYSLYGRDGPLTDTASNYFSRPNKRTLESDHRFQRHGHSQSSTPLYSGSGTIVRDSNTSTNISPRTRIDSLNSVINGRLQHAGETLPHSNAETRPPLPQQSQHHSPRVSLSGMPQFQQPNNGPREVLGPGLLTGIGDKHRPKEPFHFPVESMHSSTLSQTTSHDFVIESGRGASADVESTKARKGGKRSGPLNDDTQAKAKEVRSMGACWRCRLQKNQVSYESTS